MGRRPNCGGLNQHSGAQLEGSKVTYTQAQCPANISLGITTNGQTKHNRGKLIHMRVSPIMSIITTRAVPDKHPQAQDTS